MQYTKITCQEFNEKYGTKLNPEMTYHEAYIVLDEAFDRDNYYLDLCEEPPMEWAEELQSERWDKDSFEYYHIQGLGHIAIYQLR